METRDGRPDPSLVVAGQLIVVVPSRRASSRSIEHGPLESVIALREANVRVGDEGSRAEPVVVPGSGDVDALRLPGGWVCARIDRTRIALGPAGGAVQGHLERGHGAEESLVR